jgi:hypothetical protein
MCERSLALPALIKRIELDDDEVRIVYRVAPVPFVEAPDGGFLQDCPKGADTFDFLRPPVAGRFWASGRHWEVQLGPDTFDFPGTERILSSLMVLIGQKRLGPYSGMWGICAWNVFFLARIRNAPHHTNEITQRKSPYPTSCRCHTQ